MVTRRNLPDIVKRLVRDLWLLRRLLHLACVPHTPPPPPPSTICLGHGIVFIPACVALGAYAVCCGGVCCGGVQVDLVEASEGVARDAFVEKVVFMCSRDNYEYLEDFAWYISVLIKLAGVEVNGSPSTCVGCQGRGSSLWGTLACAFCSLQHGWPACVCCVAGLVLVLVCSRRVCCACPCACVVSYGSCHMYLRVTCRGLPTQTSLRPS